MPVSFHGVLAGRRVIAVGVPGAFTPICTREHVPDFVANADKLRAAGFDEVICVAPNDPWTLEAWASQLDPFGKVTFLSDGNLTLARGLRATIIDHAHFLGETSTRYLMIAYNGIIERLTLEAAPMALSCTRAEDVYLVA